MKQDKNTAHSATQPNRSLIQSMPFAKASNCRMKVPGVHGRPCRCGLDSRLPGKGTLMYRRRVTAQSRQAPDRETPRDGLNDALQRMHFHYSRDAHFTDELSLAMAEGLKAAGYCVDLATLTGVTPDEPRLPTLGVIAGAGATRRPQQVRCFGGCSPQGSTAGWTGSTSSGASSRTCT